MPATQTKEEIAAEGISAWHVYRVRQRSIIKSTRVSNPDSQKGVGTCYWHFAYHKLPGSEKRKCLNLFS